MVRKIRAKLVLQLRAEGLSGRAIAASQQMSRKSVTAVLEAADAASLGWDDVAELGEAEVYGLLFPGRGEHESVFVQPDWDRAHREMARVGVTLKLLHGDYTDSCAAAGEPAMGYDRFCKTYQRHVLVTGAASRVGHKAGQCVEVDWSGPTMELINPTTGEVSRVFLFVACLPFSRYAFVWPPLDMKQDTWLRAHVAMFEFVGGSVPRIVPDNLKTGVLKHPRDGEVVLNDAYREMAAHYSAVRMTTPFGPTVLGRIRGNDATVAYLSADFSAMKMVAGGVHESVLRGRLLSWSWTAARSAAECRRRSVLFGKYCRRRPLPFSLVPRCQGECGSQKYTARPVAAVIWSWLAISLP